MTRHPCTAPHAFGYARAAAAPQKPESEPGSASASDWTDEEIAKFAATEFEPWDVSDCPLPSNQEWIDGINPYLVSLRLAWATMGKTKAELVEIVEALEADDALRPMMDGLDSTERQMRGLYELASAAQARLLCAATVVNLRQEGKPCA